MDRKLEETEDNRLSWKTEESPLGRGRSEIL